MIVAAYPPLPHNYAEALAYYMEEELNFDSRTTFSDTTCHRAGAEDMEAAFVCTASYFDHRTGVKGEWKFVVLADGTITKVWPLR